MTYNYRSVTSFPIVRFFSQNNKRACKSKVKKVNYPFQVSSYLFLCKYINSLPLCICSVGIADSIVS